MSRENYKLGCLGSVVGASSTSHGGVLLKNPDAKPALGMYRIVTEFTEGHLMGVIIIKAIFLWVRGS